MAKILIVEDEPMQLEMYEMAFRANAQGVSISTATNGSEALEKVKREKPDLVLLDVILPDIDGIQILKRLKSDVQLKDIPVIVMTNYDAAGTAELAVKEGAEKYLVKSSVPPSMLVQVAKDRLKIK